MGLFFSKKRTDGNVVKGGDPMNYIMPYVMKSRMEAQVFTSYPIRLEAINEFIRQNRRKGVRITFFNVLVAALLKTTVERPRLNRFIAGRRIYEHKNFEVLYVVKEAMTETANESVARVRFAPEDTVYDVAKKMAEQTDKIKHGVLKDDDAVIRLLLKAPRCIIRAIFALYRWMDFYGIVPSAALEAFPFYSSVFVSHLGTIGGNAAYHHLYDMGTTSIFITIGKSSERAQKADDGSVEWGKEIELAFNVDERICDGYYLVKSLRLFERYMNDPWLLELPGINSDMKMSKELQEFRQKQSRARLDSKGSELINVVDGENKELGGVNQVCLTESMIKELEDRLRSELEPKIREKIEAELREVISEQVREEISREIKDLAN